MNIHLHRYHKLIAHYKTHLEAVPSLVAVVGKYVTYLNFKISHRVQFHSTPLQIQRA